MGYLSYCILELNVIYQTRERVFHRLRGVWIPDETLFRVFDMASQTIHNSWRNSKQKFAKLYANEDPVSKPPSR